MIEVTNYFPINKGALIASFAIKIPKWGNFRIHNMTLFAKNSHKWISFPSREYDDKEKGKKSYIPQCSFESPETFKLFSAQVLTAIEEFLKKNNQLELFDHKPAVDADGQPPF